MAAREFRDIMDERLQPVDRVSRMKRVTKRNWSGVPGVRLRENIVVRNGWEYTYKNWEASWTPKSGGRRVKRQFSVLKYGYDSAFQMAVEAREAALRRIKQQSKV